MVLDRVCESKAFTDKSDVYSFGVFLLELVSGTEASRLQFTGPNQGITEWVLDVLRAPHLHLLLLSLNNPFLEKLLVAVEPRKTLIMNSLLKAQDYDDSSDISTLVDRRMARSFTDKGMRDLLRLTVWCLNPSGGARPPMSFVASELDRILDKEMSSTTIMGEGTPTLTLGSELFTS